MALSLLAEQTNYMACIITVICVYALLVIETYTWITLVINSLVWKKKKTMVFKWYIMNEYSKKLKS